MLSGWRVEDLRDALPLCDAELLEYELKTAGYESDFFKNMKEWDEEEKEGEEEGEEVEEDDDDGSVEMYVEDMLSSPEMCIDTGLLDYMISDEVERNVPEMCSSVEEIKNFIREYSPLGENMISRVNTQLERIRKMEDPLKTEVANCSKT